MKARRFLALILVSTVLMGVFADVPATPAGTTAGTPAAEPYGPNEFPVWQKELRRAEIISFGSLPFVTFMTAIYYDVYRYVDHNQEQGYLPWPLKKSATAVPLTEDEQKKILLTSACISVGVAVFDYGFRALRREIRARRIERANSLIVDPIQIEPITDPETEKADK